MWRNMVCVGVLAVAAAGPAARAGESAAELLEKGIYTEETAGDLDKAIKIYDKVVAEAKAAHVLAAQAQYRIGQCLLKQGKKAEASAAFEKLTRDFADQKELVAKALPLIAGKAALQPVCWVDGETMQLRMRLNTGLELGTLVYFAQTAELQKRKIWRVGSRTYVGLTKMLGVSRVDVDADSFRPIDGYFLNSMMGQSRAKYGPTKITVTTEGPAGKQTKEIDPAGVIYDNEQALYVLRRMPLAVGYKGTLPVLGLFGGGRIEIPVEVLSQETLSVPAGKFDCFKVNLGLVNQVFWFSADAHRYLVKFDANAAVAELTALGQIKPGESHRYDDAKLGFSVAAPSDWFFYAPPSSGKDREATVLFLDAKEINDAWLAVSKPGDDKKSLRTWAEADLAEQAKATEGFKIRADTWQQRVIAGLPAWSVLADYAKGKEKRVGYYTYVEAQPRGLRLKFAAALPSDRLDSLRKPFDTIIDSLRVKP